MGLYRKKPVTIEAVPYLPDDGEQRVVVTEFLAKSEWYFADDDTKSLIIRTLEGDHRCRPGDWIIRGVQGEVYPCKPDIFTATYEPVTGNQAGA